jgi:hypothetical protein
VRIGLNAAAGAGVLLSLAGIAFGGRAQDTTVLAPEASDAKARQVIQRSIQALGGADYLGVQDSTRTGRYSRFQHSGAVTGTIKLVIQNKYPGRERIEYTFKRYFEAFLPLPLDAPLHTTNSAYELHNGDRGWVLGGGGVEELPRDMLEHREQERKRSVNVVFRERLKDPDLVLRYAGLDVVDLKQVEWIEVSDGGTYSARFAIEYATHLPNRVVYRYRDQESKQVMQEVEYYSNYHAFQGVITPMQILREQNGWLTTQIFLEEVKYNTGLSDVMFTPEGLEELRAHGGKKKN